MDAIMAVLMAAMILEALLQVIKGWVPEDRTPPGWTWPAVGAVLGVALCLLGKVDLLEEAGLYLSIPYVGSVLTGILISRGASFVHDLWKRLRGDDTGNDIAEMNTHVVYKDGSAENIKTK